MSSKHRVSRIEDLFPSDLKNAKKEPHIEYLARTSLLKIKPIVSSDPRIFLDTITKLQNLYPNLKIYIFRVVRYDR